MGIGRSELQRLTDEQLCTLASRGSADAEELLVTRCSRIVRACARPLFLAGGDSEDLLQEGMVGLLHAIRTYDPTREAQLTTYAEVCIRNRLYSAVRAAGRDKHVPLNDSVSLEAGLASDNFSASDRDPESLLIDREEWNERIRALNSDLSRLESEILKLYLSGFSYGEIAQATGRTSKSIDNAIQRIRRKVTRQFTTGEISKG